MSEPVDPIQRIEDLLEKLPADQRAQLQAVAELAAGTRHSVIERDLTTDDGSASVEAFADSLQTSRPAYDIVLPQLRRERSVAEQQANLPQRRIIRLNTIPAAPPVEKAGGKAAQRRLKQLSKKSA